MRRITPAATRPLAASAALAAALSYGGGYWLHTLHSAAAGGDVAAWLRDSTALLPVALAAVLLASVTARRVCAGGAAGRALALMLAGLFAAVAAAVAGPLYALAAARLVPAESGASLFICSVAGIEAGGGVALDSVIRDGLLLLPANLLIAGVIALLAAMRHTLAAAAVGASRPAARRAAVVGGAVALVTLNPFGGLVRSAPAAAAAPQCGPGAPTQRQYDVAAINVHIPYNRWGDIDLDGMMYALRDDITAYKNWAAPLDASNPAGNRRLRPRPLVLRANAGECVKVRFTNELDVEQWGGALVQPRASIHAIGVAYNAATSDGGRVGYNPDTTVGIGESIEYYWLAPEREGMYLFRDTAAPTGTEADGGSLAHGLFGALAVEPAGSRWYDPVSGHELYSPATSALSGELYIDAMIVPPGAPAFRESIQLAQDEIPGIGYGFNYGAEPGHNRDANRCPDCVGEETSLSSWVYGDPAAVKLASGEGPWLPSWQAGGEADPESCGIGTPGFSSESCWTANVTRAYRWDSFKLRFAMAMTYETHIFHLHANQWRAQPDDSTSTIVDSQTFGPGDAFTAELVGGAGSVPGTVGDSIFHCHLYPHFAEGFWALLRVHDVVEDGTLSTPDGIRVRALKPLPSGNLQGYAPPAASAEQPGFPRFVPGEFGWRAPQPPLGIYEQNGSADVPATIEREDLTPGMRMVAGRALDEQLIAADPAALSPEQHTIRERLLAEQQAMSLISGGRFKPGAPFADPCPAGAREVTYNVSIIQLPIVYNDAGWFDNQARILVLDKDREAILAGQKPPEPLFIRVSQGDCVNFNLTNFLPNWFGGDAFVKLAQTNMMGGHIHLVKFDVLASDGSSNGWNYQQAAFTQLQTQFKNDVLAGTQSCTADEAAGACRIPMEAGAGYQPQTSGAWPGQTLRERWYADSELRTVFTHDHHFAAVDQNRGQFGALLVEPANMNFRNPVTGQYYQPVSAAAPFSGATPCGGACIGDAAGTRMDIIGPGTKDDFREFGLAVQDFVPLHRPAAWGNPERLRDPAFAINAPHQPELFPKADPGTYGINYRNAPLQERRQLNGQPIDPAYALSSFVFGDPETPLLEAYAGDPVQFRVIQGSQEEQHTLTIHGMRWRQEPGDPESQLVNAITIGISEAFNAYVPTMSCGWDEDCRGDYLYTSGATDGVYQGAWGLFRVYGRNRNGLLPLPDTQPQNMNGNVSFKPTGAPPPPANKPGTPCVPGSPVRQFTVVAHDASITYNAEYGYSDPFGLLYTAVRPGESLEQAMARSAARPEPMVLRVNEGDCIEVTLHNRISQSWLDSHGARAVGGEHWGGVTDGDPNMPTEPTAGTPAGLRVSLHPSLLLYDVRGSDGATVGYNRDQTVGPGEQILYRWYADEVAPGELGAVNLLEYGDVRGHRHHGLLAGLVVGPKNATYHDPVTGAQVSDGVAVDVRVPGQADWRDLAVFYQDGLNLRRADGSFVLEPAGMAPELPEDEEGGLPNPLHPAGEGANEDIGEKGFNYGTEPLYERLGRLAVAADAGNPLSGRELADLFSSVVHGDPATPILRAHAGDPVRVRLLQTGDRPRQHVFQIGGHGWLDDPWDPFARYTGGMNGVGPARSFNLHIASAGSALWAAGDYRYGSLERNHFASRGLWGIFRVYGPPQAQPVPAASALLPEDSPYTAGYSPILPLELATVGASVYLDQDQNGARGRGETGMAGVTVHLRAAGGEVLASAVTDANGDVRFEVRPGLYDLEVPAAPRLSTTTAARLRADAQGENSKVMGGFGVVKLANIVGSVFDDRNGNGVQDSGEAPLSGWSVRLLKGNTPLATAASDSSGRVTFADLRPAQYSVETLPGAGYFATTVNPTAVSLSGADAEVRAGIGTIAGLSVQLFNDIDGDGAQDVGERALADWKVTLSGGPSELTPVAISGRTGTGGALSFDRDPDPAINGLLPGSYGITVAAPRDWACQGTASVQVYSGTAGGVGSCQGNSFQVELPADTSKVVTIPFRNPYHWVVAEPFNDVNRDGVRGSGEGKLVGFTVRLRDSSGALIGEKLTGSDGKASWQITSAPWQSRSYRVEIVPAAATIIWEPTSQADMSITVAPGDIGTARAGYVQPATVGVRVFEDHDQDGEQDSPFEGALANRNVLLYDKGNKILLATAVTNANGEAVFRITSGTTYNLEVLAPTGWQRTTQLNAKGVPLTRLKIVAPTGNASAEYRFGQYNTADSTPPPAPELGATSGSYGAPVAVSFESETGARFRYSLDGSTPTATTGYPLIDGAVTIARPGTSTLTVVALDKAGNVSQATQGSFSITYGPDAAAPLASFVTSPRDWTVLKGGISVGYAHWLAYAGDGQALTLRTSRLRNESQQWEHMADGFGTLIVPEGQRDLRGLELRLIEKFNKAGPTRLIALWNYQTAQWETVESPQLTGSTAFVEGTVAVEDDPATPENDLLRFVDPSSGELRVRIFSSWSSGSFTDSIDLLHVRVRYQP